MSGSPFLPSAGEPPFESFPILEDTEARKVIVLWPRGDGKLGLGCLFLLFFPAMFVTVPLVMSLIHGIEAGGCWLIVSLWSIAVTIPLGLIVFGKGQPLSETSLLLERHQITLREEQFDRQTGESINAEDETIRIGPGSGLTDGESMLRESGEHIPFTIWGPTDSLSIPRLDQEKQVEWLRHQVSDWLQRVVVAPTNSAEAARESTPLIDEPSRMEFPRHSESTETFGSFQPPLDTKINILDETAKCLTLRISPGGAETTSLRWQALWVSLFMTGFTAVWWYGLKMKPEWDVVWGVALGLGLLWLVTGVLVIVAIRLSLETLDLELTHEQCILKKTILGWPRRKAFALEPPSAIYLKTNQWHGRRPIPTVCIRGVDGTAEFGTMLSEKEKRWLVVRLREFLHLDQRTSIFAESERLKSCPRR